LPDKPAYCDVIMIPDEVNDKIIRKVKFRVKKTIFDLTPLNENKIKF